MIGCDNLQDLYTWVNAAYAVHPNMRSHTGGLMSMGYGSIHTRSAKQKLNTKSSTESEVVRLSDYLPSIFDGLIFFEFRDMRLLIIPFFKITRAPLEWRRMAETVALATQDILISGIFL